MASAEKTPNQITGLAWADRLYKRLPHWRVDQMQAENKYPELEVRAYKDVLNNALALFVLGVCTIANPCWSIGYLTFGHICAWAFPYFGFIAWPAAYFVYACVDGGFALANGVLAALGGCWVSLFVLELPILLLNGTLAYLITKVDPSFSARKTCTRIFNWLRGCFATSQQPVVTTHNTAQASAAPP